MDIDKIKAGIVTNVYHITADKKIALHNHVRHDELFYCLKGDGFGVLNNEETEITEGDVIVVPSGVMHSLRTNGHLIVSSFLVPALTEI
jgi:mannose-6-phosphate isomerase-like protein (cupin superfamily)